MSGRGMSGRGMSGRGMSSRGSGSTYHVAEVTSPQQLEDEHKVRVVRAQEPDDAELDTLRCAPLD